MRKLIETASTHPVPDPGSDYWDGYWERLQARLSAAGASPVRPASSRISRWALPAAAAALAGLALIIGLGRLRPPQPAGPIAAVTLRNGTLSIRGNGPGIYQLDNAPQGGLALRLQLGGAVELCAAVGPKDAANDTTGKFVGVRNANAPVSCPPVP